MEGKDRLGGRALRPHVWADYEKRPSDLRKLHFSTMHNKKGDELTHDTGKMVLLKKLP